MDITYQFQNPSQNCQYMPETVRSKQIKIHNWCCQVWSSLTVFKFPNVVVVPRKRKAWSNRTICTQMLTKGTSKWTQNKNKYFSFPYNWLTYIYDNTRNLFEEKIELTIIKMDTSYTDKQIQSDKHLFDVIIIYAYS